MTLFLTRRRSWFRLFAGLEHFADLPLLERVVLLHDLLVQPVGVLDAGNRIGDTLRKKDFLC